MKSLILLSALFLLQACATKSDPHLWLEQIQSKEALEWVEARNQKTIAELEGKAFYPKIQKTVRSLTLAKDRLPMPSAAVNGYLFNFWQDEKHVRGIWRRTKVSSYRQPHPVWETILDLDQLAKVENENWVWKGADCLPPLENSCLINLSRGGKDASVIREFDVRTKSFVKDGFVIPESKSWVSWRDENSLYVSTILNPGDDETNSGYPRRLRILHRNEDLKKARVVDVVNKKDNLISGFTEFSPFGDLHFLYRGLSFIHHEVFLLQADGSKIQLPLPSDANYQGRVRDHLYFLLRSDWKLGDKLLKANSLVSLPLEDLRKEKIALVYEPAEKEVLQSLVIIKNEVYLQMYRNISGVVAKVDLSVNPAKLTPLALKANGSIDVLTSSPYEPAMYLTYEDFLTPETVYEYKGDRITSLKSLPARFDASQFKAQQYEATSRDGTKIPYYVFSKRGMTLHSKNPTVLYGYGGFSHAMRPYYSGSLGKIWANNGGVYVIANIRGGNEFGPAWHEAARLKNRQKAFDDFIAVAEDLIARKITSREHLAIQGGSNGGLLVGATMTQRPELFKAAVCQVPLLDMLRYHKLLAGASWMDEYGNPENSDMRKAISAYSPYQNLKKSEHFPRVLFVTSTQDDRVHPGHARKMMAKMESLGLDGLYYENTEGGHSAAANLNQRIKRQSLEWTFLASELGLQIK